MKNIDISIIVPIYKAENILKNSIKLIKKELKKLKYSYEIIIANDEEIDNSYKIAKKLAKNKKIKVLHNPKKQGRGKALKKAFKISKGRIFIYMDVDLATELSYLKQLINAIKKEKYDISIGSRLLKNSKVINRNIIREISSRSYNFLVKFFLKSKINDHQCGFKAYNKKTCKKLFNSIIDNKWFFDTESLVRAQKLGLKIKEIPVKWQDNKYGNNSTVSLFKDIKEMGSSIFKLMKQL